MIWFSQIIQPEDSCVIDRDGFYIHCWAEQSKSKDKKGNKVKRSVFLIIGHCMHGDNWCITDSYNKNQVVLERKGSRAGCLSRHGRTSWNMKTPTVCKGTTGRSTRLPFGSIGEEWFGSKMMIMMVMTMAIRDIHTIFPYIKSQRTWINWELGWGRTSIKGLSGV